jgi:hypothetical protein
VLDVEQEVRVSFSTTFYLLSSLPFFFDFLTHI